MILDINNRAKLLLQKYENLQDGRIKLYPCTMVFLYDGPAESEEERKRQSIVLEAPEGAIVKFDAPIDPKQLKIGRPIGGHLLGKITIRSDGKSPGPEDDLLIHARDMVWNDQDATSDNPVDFQWGKNCGSGSGMHIKLRRAIRIRPPTATARTSRASKSSRCERSTACTSKAIRTSRRTHGGESRSAGSPAAAKTSARRDADTGPIDITCRGAFRFNLPKRVASFEDHVEVMQLNPGGPANQLLCDKLSMFFMPRDKDQPPRRFLDRRPGARADRSPRQAGHALLAAKKNVYAQGEHLAYNLKTNLIELDGGPEVYLKQGEKRNPRKELAISCKIPPNAEALGKAWVKGPGWLHAAMDDKPDQQLRSPLERRIESFAQGRLPGDFAHRRRRCWNSRASGKCRPRASTFWLSETAAVGPSKEMQIKPVKMLAKTNVAPRHLGESRRGGRFHATHRSRR